VTLNDGVKLPSQLKESKLLATAYYQIGHLYSDRNLFPEAIAAYENSKAGFERAGLIRDEIYVLADLGALYFIQEDYKKARECSEQSLRIAESANSSEPAGAYPDDFGKARALLTLGDLDTNEGNYEQAVEKLQKSMALYRRLNGSGSSYDLYIAGVYGALGRAYPEIGDSTTGLAPTKAANPRLSPNVEARQNAISSLEGRKRSTQRRCRNIPSASLSRYG